MKSITVRRSAAAARLSRSVLYCCVWCGLSGGTERLAAQPAEQSSLIQNGNFATWTGNAPDHWTIEIGASNGGRQPASEVTRAEGSALRLSGTAHTLAWNLVKQSVPLQPEAGYRLSFVAQAKDVRREGRQYDNCYVGVFLKDRQGQIVGRYFHTVWASDWQADWLTFRTPANTASGDVSIFLSKTGELLAKDVRLEALRPADSFQVLVEDMDRYYSFFAHKQVDWRQLTEKYRARAEGAKDSSQFGEVVAEMLAELRDMHTWLEVPGIGQVSKYRSAYDANFDFKALASQLRGFQNFGQLGFVGRTSAGYGYINISSLTSAEQADQLIAAAEKLFDAPGLIIDLRKNGGGAEPLAARFAALFTDSRRPYAGSRFRAGPSHDDFTEINYRYLGPREGTTYTRPIVCLIGPGCISSGEGFALMLTALPHVTMVGQATRGASGNPAPVMLPNGIDVWYSRWLSLLPDGTPLEGSGVPPDIKVDHAGPGDPTFVAAEKILAQKIAADQK